jgi:hypothetical protein
VANGQNGRNLDPGIKRVLEELRDLRSEMRTDRQQESAARRRADEEWRQERARSDARFEQMMREFRQDSARREAATQKAFGAIQSGLKDIRTVGLAIVKTLNRNTRILEHISEHHGRLLEHIDRKLDARWNGRPGRGNGRA